MHKRLRRFRSFHSLSLSLSSFFFFDVIVLFPYSLFGSRCCRRCFLCHSSSCSAPMLFVFALQLNCVRQIHADNLNIAFHLAYTTFPHTQSTINKFGAGSLLLSTRPSDEAKRKKEKKWELKEVKWGNFSLEFWAICNIKNHPLIEHTDYQHLKNDKQMSFWWSFVVFTSFCCDGRWCCHCHCFVTKHSLENSIDLPQSIVSTWVSCIESLNF